MPITTDTTLTTLLSHSPGSRPQKGPAVVVVKSIYAGRSWNLSWGSPSITPSPELMGA